MPNAATKMSVCKTVAFGDVARLAKERSSDPVADGLDRFVGLEHIDPGDLRVRRWGNVSDGVTFTSVFRAGHVLFGKRRAYQRKVAVPDFAGVCSSDIYVLEPTGTQLLPALLPFICQTDAFLAHAVGTSAGSLSPRTNWRSLAAFKLSLPSPDEQKRLVNALVAAEATYDAHMRLAEAAQQVEQSYAAELLRPATKKEMTRLGDVAREDITRIAVSAKATYRTAGVLNGGQGLFAKEPLCGSETRYTHLLVLRHNQLVMRKLTAWEGAIAVVSAEFDGAVVSAEFPTITLDERRLLPAYMAWVIQQPAFWREMKARSRGTALRRSRLHQRDLLKINLRVPSLEHQAELVDQMNSIRAASEAARNRAGQVQAILKAIVETAFGGQVTSTSRSSVKEGS